MTELKQQEFCLKIEGDELVKDFIMGVWFDCHNVNTSVRRNDSHRKMLEIGPPILEVFAQIMTEYNRSGFFEDIKKVKIPRERFWNICYTSLVHFYRKHHLGDTPYPDDVPFGKMMPELWIDWCMHNHQKPALSQQN